MKKPLASSLLSQHLAGLRFSINLADAPAANE
jgi:hypothetical protein